MSRFSSLLVVLAFASLVEADEPAYIVTKKSIRLLSINDGEAVPVFDESQHFRDSVTLIELGPDGPPRIRTVYDTVPNTILGAPYMAISASGKLGFATNHGFRLEDATTSKTDHTTLTRERQNLLSVIDLDSPKLTVVQQLPLPSSPCMVAAHPDKKHILVGCGQRLFVYAVREGNVELVKENALPVFILSFAVNPTGNRIVATAIDDFREGVPPSQLPIGIHILSLRGTVIQHESEVEIDERLGKISQPFAPRFSPNGDRVLVLNGGGKSEKGSLDDVLSVDMTMPEPRVTEVIPQVADGLESVAFHPHGHLAVVTCLGTTSKRGFGYGRLAVIDLKRQPAQLVSQIRVENIPEGIQFSPSGEKLFVQSTSAHYISVFNVDGYRLNVSPFVLQTGQGPASMAIWSE
jgi:DNA-binding beta-propeller fold protein YncE